MRQETSARGRGDPETSKEASLTGGWMRTIGDPLVWGGVEFLTLLSSTINPQTE